MPAERVEEIERILGTAELVLEGVKVCNLEADLAGANAATEARNEAMTANLILMVLFNNCERLVEKE
jgi:hypothetical protein